MSRLLLQNQFGSVQADVAVEDGEVTMVTLVEPASRSAIDLDREQLMAIKRWVAELQLGPAVAGPIEREPPKILCGYSGAEGVGHYVTVAGRQFCFGEDLGAANVFEGKMRLEDAR